MRRVIRRVRNNTTAGDIGVGTFFFELNGGETSLSSFHLKFGSALVTSAIQYQTSNLAEVAADSTTTGDWVTESSVSITNAAASASGQVIHVGNDGSYRQRLRIVVTTGGGLDIATCDKEA